jgi:hypothetical protein
MMAASLLLRFPLENQFLFGKKFLLKESKKRKSEGYL